MKKLPSLSPVNAGRLARLCGVAPSTVSTWIAAGMPCRRVGRPGSAVSIDLRQALPWIVTRCDPPGSQRERLLREHANKIALQNAKTRNSLVYADQVAEVFPALRKKLDELFTAAVESLVPEVAGISDPGVIRARLLVGTRGIRSGLADFLAAMAAEADGGSPVAARG